MRNGVVGRGDGARAGDEREGDDDDDKEVRYEVPNLFGRSLTEGNGCVGDVECSKGDWGCTVKTRFGPDDTFIS